MTLTTTTGITYDDTGAGTPALLFLPGWCGPRTLFDPLLQRLRSRFRCLALDWRGHGHSTPVRGDFGTAELVEDALAVVDVSGASPIVPVAASHAGWVAIELRRRLGGERVPKLVLIDWMVTGAPAPFLGALTAMADPASTRAVVDQVTGMWTAGLDIADLTAYVATMSATPDEMWARAARAITTAFQQHPSPLETLAALDPAPATLHLYAQPDDPAYAEAQRTFADTHAWYEFERLEAASHFPMFEIPDRVARRLAAFVAP